MAKKILLPIFMTIFTISLLSFPSDSTAVGDYYRIAGSNRITTAIEISRHVTQSPNVVILARADDPADALAAASIAGYHNAPILLTPTNKLSDYVIAELNSMQVYDVFILGGLKAISDGVESELNQLGYRVTRFAGSSRFETAAKINDHLASEKNLYEGEGPNTPIKDKAIIVNGYTVADALSASSASAINSIPIYLSKKSHLPVELPSYVKEVTIYGGEGVISKEVYDSLVAKGLKVTRIGGKNRFDTNIKSLDPSKGENIILVRGTSVSLTKEDYPDAVASSALAKKLNANIVIVHPTKPIAEVVEHFSKNRYVNIYVLGGESAVSSDVAINSTAFVDTTLSFLIEDGINDSVIHPTEPIIYYTAKNVNLLWYMNFETGESDYIWFQRNPESLYFANGKLYVALHTGQRSNYWNVSSQQGSVAIIDPATFQVEKEMELNLDPYDIVIDKNGILYVSSGSGQWTDIRSYDTTTEEQLSRMRIYSKQYIQLDPSEKYIYTIDWSTIEIYTIESGKLIEVNESNRNYDGHYIVPDGVLDFSPDGKYMFNNSGNVFHTDSLYHYKKLQYEYEDIVFDEMYNLFMIGRKGLILFYDYDTFEIVSAISTIGEVDSLHLNNNYIVSITKLDPNTEEITYGVEVFPK
jgi:putative cell wall-binding protein